jgi:RNA polymerase sigma factor (sigma-70 family)
VEGRPLEEAELIERSRAGNTDAYAELVRRYQEAAFRAAYLVTHDADEAADAAQDAFIKAHRALSSFRAGAAFGPWLLRIVVNEARNRRRSAGRRGGLALRVVQDRPSVDAAPSADTTSVPRPAEPQSAPRPMPVQPAHCDARPPPSLEPIVESPAPPRRSLDEFRARHAISYNGDGRPIYRT